MDAGPTDGPRARLGSIAAGLVLATTALVLARVVLMALKDGYLAAGLLRLATRSAARHLLEGYALCVAPALLAALVLDTLGRRRARAALGLALLATLVAAYLFTSFRLPERTYYAPQLEGARAWAAHAGAGLVALVATLLLAVRLPARPTAPLAWAACLLPLGAASLRLWPTRANADGRPNLILVSIDTLRADRLGCYGYARPTSPVIDELARDAIVFRNAYSPESWTLPAHMTMLTSLYPTSHGVEEERALPRGVPTLATLLAREGYATFGIVDDAHWIGPQFGFDRGFESYHVMPGDADVKADAVLSLLDDLDRRPFFLFVHIYDVHSDKRGLPYEADPRDVEAFAGWYEGDFTGCNERGECASELLFAMVGRRETLSPEDAEYVSSLYDAGIRTLDRKLERLFDGLERRGLLDDSALLLTADHGEEFFEHGRPVHTQYFDECVKVPFILRPPGGRRGRPGVSDELVSLVDVLPTLLELGGTRPEVTQGISLAPILSGAPLDTRRDAILIDGRQPLLGLRTPRWSLVPTDGRLAGFDTLEDPAQASDLLATEAPPAELEALRSRLDEETARLRSTAERFGPGERRETSREEAEQLRALGYGGDG